MTDASCSVLHRKQSRSRQYSISARRLASSLRVGREVGKSGWRSGHQSTFHLYYKCCMWTEFQSISTCLRGLPPGTPAKSERFTAASSRCRQKLKYQKFHVVAFQITSKHCSNKRAARAARLFFFIQPIRSLIWGVVVDIAVLQS